MQKTVTTKESFNANLVQQAKERVGKYIQKSINGVPQSKIDGEAAYHSFGFLCSVLNEVNRAESPTTLELRTTIVPFPDQDCGCMSANRNCWDGPAIKDGFIFDVETKCHRLMTKEEKNDMSKPDPKMTITFRQYCRALWACIVLPYRLRQLDKALKKYIDHLEKNQ